MAETTKTEDMMRFRGKPGEWEGRSEEGDGGGRREVVGDARRGSSGGILLGR